MSLRHPVKHVNYLFLIINTNLQEIQNLLVVTDELFKCSKMKFKKNKIKQTKPKTIIEPSFLTCSH